MRSRRLHGAAQPHRGLEESSPHEVAPRGCRDRKHDSSGVRLGWLRDVGEREEDDASRREGPYRVWVLLPGSELPACLDGEPGEGLVCAYE